MGHGGRARRKKLLDVARAFYGGADDGDNSIKPSAFRDMEVLGIRWEGALPAHNNRDAIEIEVEPENWGAVLVERAMQTQYNLVPIVTTHGYALVRTGLNMAAVPVVAQALGFAVDAELLANLDVLSRAAVKRSQDDARPILTRRGR